MIRHVNSKTFVEDPLRVYRAIQFASRFNFEIAEETKDLIRSMINNNLLDDLPKERVFTEINKLMLKSEKPSIGFELLREFGILERYFPELYAIIGVQQDKKWHPEGDVWIHTMMVVDEMAKFTKENGNLSEEKKVVYLYSALCHDLGKVLTTEFINGKWRSPNHEAKGVEPTISFLNKLTNNKGIINDVSNLVKYHLQPALLYTQKSSIGAIKRLAKKVNLLDVVILNRADHLGRTTEKALNKETSVYNYFLDIIDSKLSNFDIDKKREKENIVSGKDLINLGIKPGKELGAILRDVYEKQLDSYFKDKSDAIEYVKNIYLNNNELELN